VRLTGPARKALAGGLAFGAVATGVALAQDLRHGFGIGLAVVVALVLAVGAVQLASRRAERT
jgi:hypothetical protein